MAFALQADGWWLRSDIIWSKPNPMPESVRDRPTKAHEYIFMLSRSGTPQFWSHRDHAGTRSQPEPDYRWFDRLLEIELTDAPENWRTEMVENTKGEEELTEAGDEITPNRIKRYRRFNLWRAHDYYYDAEAIKEPFATDPAENYPARARITGRGTQGAAKARGNDRDKSGGFPPASYKGSSFNRGKTAIHELGRASDAPREDSPMGRNKRSVWTVATYPVKDAHFGTYPPDLIEPCILAGCPAGGTVLDPFAGSGTTGLAAIKHGRQFLGIGLNPEYIKIADKRLREHFSLFAEAECST